MKLVIINGKGDFTEILMSKCEVIMSDKNGYFTFINGKLKKIKTELSDKVILDKFVFISGKKITRIENEEASFFCGGKGYEMDDTLCFFNPVYLHSIDFESVEDHSKVYTVHLEQYVSSIKKLETYKFFVSNNATSPTLNKYFA